MNVLAWSLRSLAKLRFRVLGLATIKDIPTERFNAAVDELRTAGWRQTYEYEGVDAWIDYGQIKLQKDRVRLNLEWDNWSEGSIEGPRHAIETIGRDLGLPVHDQWRWTDKDDA